MIDQHLLNIWWKENRNFLVECCFCALIRNRSKFENIAFRRLLALDHQTLHRGDYWYPEQNKLTLWVLGYEM